MSKGKKTRLYYHESPEYQFQQQQIQRRQIEEEQLLLQDLDDNAGILKDTRKTLIPGPLSPIPSIIPRSITNPEFENPTPQAPSVQSYPIAQRTLDERYGSNGWSQTPSGDWIVPEKG
jgi:hypothetical protein